MSEANLRFNTQLEALTSLMKITLRQCHSEIYWWTFLGWYVSVWVHVKMTFLELNTFLKVSEAALLHLETPTTTPGVVGPMTSLFPLWSLWPQTFPSFGMWIIADGIEKCNSSLSFFSELQSVHTNTSIKFQVCTFNITWDPGLSPQPHSHTSISFSATENLLLCSLSDCTEESVKVSLLRHSTCCQPHIRKHSFTTSMFNGHVTFFPWYPLVLRRCRISAS